MSKPWLISEETVAEAWERLVSDVWREGIVVPKYGRELTALVRVEHPFKEPRKHVGDLYCAVKGQLSSYIEEVLEGTLDYAIDKGKVSYTYHDRLFRYKALSIEGEEISYWDQVSLMAERLSTDPESNQIQSITWRMTDHSIEHPPCLQRVWCKIIEGKLVMHTTWRSRDAFRAWHMNVLAMTELQRLIADKAGVGVGPYIDFSNSVHIYEDCWGKVERFLKVAMNRKKC